MHVEYRVQRLADRWVVLRGATEPLRYDSEEAALAAALALARAACARGDRVAVRHQRAGAAEAIHNFAPEKIGRLSSTTYDPEADFARRSGSP